MEGRFFYVNQYPTNLMNESPFRKVLKRFRIAGVTALACCSLVATAQTVTPEKRVLVFSKTAGFRHSSIPAGKTAILKLGKETGFAVDTTENAAVFTNKNLQKYSAVIFLNTTGNVLNDK